MGGALHIVQADGARLVFARSVVGAGLYRHADPARGAVRIARIEGGDEYDWLWPNGRELRFDRNGRLMRIALPGGEALDLQRTPEGRLLRVRDPQGRELRIRYANAASGSERIVGIDTPVGRIDYEHGEAKNASALRLETARLPVGRGKTMRRIYHHEDEHHPLLLTGISVEAQEEGKSAGLRERLRGWTYDAAGRAVGSLSGESLRLAADGKPLPGPSDEQLVFRRLTPGLTLLTDGAGRSTEYRHTIINGEFRLLEARGAGCASCGPVNLRYGYDRLARLTEVTRLDAAGKAIEGRALELDALGRLLSLTRIDYANGKPSRRTPLLRQQYAPEIGPFLWPWRGRARPPFGPILIAWPSVVPGREHQLRIEYNRRQQPVLLSESGFDPQDGSKIERSMRYRYEDRRGRSLLTEVEGPWSPGAGVVPDVIRHVWDAQGSFVARSILPGNVELAYARDEGSGRLTATTLRWDDVFRRRSFETDAAGRLLGQSDAALDAAGRVIALRRIDIDTDARGRPARIRWPDGGVSTLTHDASGLPMPVSLPGGGLALWSRAEDEAAPPPSAVFKAMRGPPGSASENIVLRYDANARSAERKLDDFGRLVAIRLPEQGWQTARYDAADRLVHVTDARGATTALVHDTAGRLRGVVRALADGSMAEQLRFAWRGPYRVEETVIEEGHARRVYRYRHDPFGEVECTELEIDDGAGAPLRLALETRYDEVGRRISQTLPGGERLVWRYFADAPYRGQRAAVERLRWPAWLDGVMVKLPERWLDALRLKLRLAELEPEDRQSEAAPSLIFAASPQPEPGLAETAPGSEHDAAGLPQRLRTEKGEFRLVWNAAGALAEVHPVAASGAAPVARYRYDARGRRVEKHTAAGSEYYLYDGTQLVAVASHVGKRLRVRGEYLYAGYRPLLWFHDGETLRLETDHRGAVLATSEPAGRAGKATQRWQSNIDAWGRAHPTGAGDPRLRLVNQYADEENGLHYHVARYYDPATGRFLSPDPAGIADSIDAATPDALKLDISAYVSGQPSLYFDPDAAAKLVYYALTTDAKGKPLPTKQGFTGARWAFSIEDIQAGATTGDEALDKLIGDYAQKHTGLLYDLGGDFLTNRKKPYATWDGAADETVDAFKRHYQGNIVQLPQFSFVNFSDKNAALLIARITGNTKELGSCPAASVLLPAIEFGEGEAGINVTKNLGNLAERNANLQRILNCDVNKLTTLKVSYENELEKLRVEKIEAAAELNETAGLNKDCSQNGCPGIDIVGQQGPNGEVPRIYHASYGRSQFVAVTFIETIKTLSNDEMQLIGMTQDIKERIEAADKRALKLGREGGWFDVVRRVPCKNAEDAWDNAMSSTVWTDQQRKRFQEDTMLDRQAFIDIACFQPDGKGRPIGEGRNAFMTETIFSDRLLKEWLMQLYKGFDKFNYISRVFIRNNLRKVIGDKNLRDQFVNDEVQQEGEKKSDRYLFEQRRIEENLAMRTARLHNGGLGAFSNEIGNLTRDCKKGAPCDLGGYVTTFIGITPGRGDWRSLRCFSDEKSRGLEMIPLKI
ncbi:RHS repeat domain-containing protein [Noviherbaspirillum pedocola]|uniref:Uncharacterized protein n=1 Tax=Noviherbaspirillum pedocola TaxID=2801341 RepID=A0A934SWY8_9BURK|nr:RHS repeat-associated core domain-containing protein [Noviherbaspirillum pedocola]MBK4733343.1 hypothetical protein [Noviherbaspirillum pedocola]